MMRVQVTTETVLPERAETWGWCLASWPMQPKLADAARAALTHAGFFSSLIPRPCCAAYFHFLLMDTLGGADVV